MSFPYALQSTKTWVILAFLKSFGRGPSHRCTSHPEPQTVLKPWTLKMLGDTGCLRMCLLYWKSICDPTAILQDCEATLTVGLPPASGYVLLDRTQVPTACFIEKQN